MQDSSSSSYSREQQNILTRIESALVELSSSKANVIATGLATALDRLLVASESARAPPQCTRTILHLFELLHKCLQYQWGHIVCSCLHFSSIFFFFFFFCSNMIFILNIKYIKKI